MRFFLFIYLVATVFLFSPVYSADYPLVGFCWVSNPLSDLTALDEGFAVAHYLGCQMEHRQYNWNEIEKDKNQYTWNTVDQWYTTCIKYNIVPSLAVCPLNSNSPEKNFPQDLRGKPLDDPDVVVRLQQFTDILLNRYPALLYVSFGNEINYYLRGHWDEVQQYQNLCYRLYQYVKENYPQVTVLVIHGFTGMEKREEDLVQQFLPACDIVGISVYHACIDVSSVSPPQLTDKEMRKGLTHCINLCNGKRFSIVETCAFSYPDPQYQAQYIHVFFDIIKEYRNKMEFACWFSTYDWYPGTLTMMNPFLEQFNTSGLLEPDGTPKPAYYAWMEEMSSLGIGPASYPYSLFAVVMICLVLLVNP